MLIFLSSFPDIKRFHQKYPLFTPSDFKSEPYIDMVKEQAWVFMKRIFGNGTKNSVLFEKAQAPKSTRSAEHEKVYLPLPSIFHWWPQFGPIVSKALAKDDSTEGNLAQYHVIIFSSINPLWQVTIMSAECDNCVIACIDSTHGWDTSKWWY
jgi:hypothetical protein